MGQPIRHIVSGVEATIDSANPVTPWDIWVDIEQLPEALRQINKLSQTSNYKPEIYPAREDSTIADSKVCIKL